MKIYNIKDKREDVKHGVFALIYGDTGVGKSFNSALTLPRPSLWINREPRDPLKTFEAAGVSSEDIDVVSFDNFDESMEWLCDLKNTERYMGITDDGLSYLMSVDLSDAISGEIFEAMDEKKRERKSLIARSKMTEEGWGSLANNMLRVTKALGDISKQGKLVVATALTKQNPKFDRNLSCAPNFVGRKFPDIAPALFDIIGYVRESFDEHGTKNYPPTISFEDFEGKGFMAKWTGHRPENSPRFFRLDWQTIMKQYETNGNTNQT